MPIASGNTGRYQRIGARAYMRSTYDRRGGNEGADASHFLYQSATTSMSRSMSPAPAFSTSSRYNHWHGSPWHYVVDGTDHVIQRNQHRRSASTRRPESVFEPAKLLPNPLTWTWSDTQGADLMWVPMGFEKSFQMAYSRTHYGTGYYIYHQFVPGAKLSRADRSVGWRRRRPTRM